MGHLHIASPKEQGDHVIIKKKNIFDLKQKFCNLDAKHKELEKQYIILYDNNSQLSKARDVFIPLNSPGCEKCCNINLTIYTITMQIWKRRGRKLPGSTKS